jgi:hypothetical protein
MPAESQKHEASLVLVDRKAQNCCDATECSHKLLSLVEVGRDEFDCRARISRSADELIYDVFLV